MVFISLAYIKTLKKHSHENIWKELHRKGKADQGNADRKDLDQGW
jgi:hypothetical protein